MAPSREKNAMRDRATRLSFIALLASALTFVGWAALNLVPQKQSWHWMIYPGGILAMPGVGLSVTVAMIFSPQGGHGADDFSWLVVPVNLVFYFMVFFFLLQRRKSPRAAD
jgi:hypothetical protein